MLHVKHHYYQSEFWARHECWSSYYDSAHYQSLLLVTDDWDSWAEVHIFKFPKSGLLVAAVAVSVGHDLWIVHSLSYTPASFYVCNISLVGKDLF